MRVRWRAFPEALKTKRVRRSSSLTPSGLMDDVRYAGQR